MALEIYEKRWVAVLDDSSGVTIELTCARRRAAVKAGSKKPTSNDDTGDKKKNRTTIGIGTGIGIASKQAADIHQRTSLNIPQQIENQKDEAHEEEEEEEEVGMTATGRPLILTGFDVGSIVKAKGGISTFRGVKQITLERLTPIRSTTEEVRTWMENSAFRRDVLDRPWVVSAEDQRRLKKEAEGQEDKESRRERWKRRRRREEERRRKRRGAYGDEERRE